MAQGSPSIPKAAPPSSRTSAMLYAGVFFTFAPVGILIAMCQPSPWGWGAGLVSAAFSGVIALGWVYAISMRRWWLLVPLLVLPPFAADLVYRPAQWLGVFALGDDLSTTARMIIHAVLATAMVSIGFTLTIRFVQRQEASQSRLRTEIDLAQRIHDNLIPALRIVDHGFEAAGRCEASAEMGGDLLDAVRRDGRTDLFVADVSGHGVGAAVVMAMVKSALRMRLSGEDDLPLTEVLTDLSRVVAEVCTEGMFVTLACVRLVRNSREVEVALAGHPPVFIRRASGAMERIDNDALPLGIRAEETFGSVRVALDPGDSIVLYTDGLFEVFNDANAQLGIDGLEAIVRDACAHAPLDALDEMLTRVRAFGPKRDDQTALVLRLPRESGHAP